jgi:hypothetical protein
MKHTQKLTRRQIVLSGCAFLILGGAALIPWRVVAQDGKPAANPQVNSPADVDKPAAAKDAKGESSPEQLIIGTWRGVLANVENNSQEESEVVFRPDKTYQDYSRRFFPGNVPGSPAPQLAYDRGRWRIKGDELILTADSPAIPFLKGLTPPGQAPPQEITDFAPERPLRSFTIVLLSDSLLRLQTPRTADDANFGASAGAPAGFGSINPSGGMPVPATGNLTLFYRRDKAIPTVQKYDSSIPKEVRDIAERAGLTPPEALELADHIRQLNKKLKRAGGKELTFDWIEKVAAAREGRMDFQKLFDLTDAEATAYAQLMKLTNLHYQGAVGLEYGGQLTPEESSAVKKLQEVEKQMGMYPVFCGKTADELSIVIDPKTGDASLTVPQSDSPGVPVMGGTFIPQRGFVTSGVPENREPTAKQKMMGKMQNYLGGLQSWLGATVFTQ